MGVQCYYWTVSSSASQLAYAKRRRQERLAAGQCGACGKPPSPGRKLCQACSDWQKTHRAKRISSGVCVQCGASDPARGRYCQTCAETRNATLRQKNAQLKAEGRCRCGRQLRPGKHNCQLCFDRSPSKKHGLSRVAAAELLATQNGRCKICNVECSTGARLPNVDHCHMTGRVRGVLCQRCNHSIGWLETARDEGVLDAALRYIGVFK